MKAWMLVVAAMALAAPADAANRLETEPPGLLLELEGPVRLGGTTPLPLADLPFGPYRIRVEGPGRPIARGRLRIDAGGRLHAGRYAGPGALLVPPGLVHLRSGEGPRGLVLLGAGLAAVGTGVVQELDRADAVDDLDRAQRRYDELEAEADLRVARFALIGAHQAAEDAETIRNLWWAFAGAAWIGAAMETWLLTPAPSLVGGGDRPALRVGAATRAGAAARSALFPGGGQRYLGREARGNRFTAGVGLAAAAALVAHESYLDRRRAQDDAQRRYRAALTEDEARLWRGRLLDAADEAETRDRVRWILGGLAAALHAWNVVDAVLPGGESGGPVAWSLNVAPAADGVRTALTWRID